MPDIRNLTDREQLVSLEKRHIALAPAGESGDTKNIADREVLANRRGRTPIQDLVDAGIIEIVAGTYESSISSPLLQGEQDEGLSDPTVTSYAGTHTQPTPPTETQVPVGKWGFWEDTSSGVFFLVRRTSQGMPCVEMT